MNDGYRFNREKTHLNSKDYKPAKEVPVKSDDGGYDAILIPHQGVSIPMVPTTRIHKCGGKLFRPETGGYKCDWLRCSKCNAQPRRPADFDDVRSFKRSAA